MAYSVRVTPEAERAINEIFEWTVSAWSAEQAVRYIAGIEHDLLSLQENPERAGLAPDQEAYDVEVRQLLTGRGRHRHRILFTIDHHARAVTILTLRHTAQRPLL